MITKQRRAKPGSGYALGISEQDGCERPLENPMQYVRLVRELWILGTVIDKKVLEVTREGWEWILKEDIDPAEAEALKGELLAVNKLLESPNKDEAGKVMWTFKDLLKSAAWYNQVMDDWMWEFKPDLLGRPTAIWPLPAEYMIRRAPDATPEFFCARCYKPDDIYDERYAACPKCGGPLAVTAWIMTDEAGKKTVGRYAADEVAHGNSRAFGGQLRGSSPVRRVWVISQILKWMERYQHMTYASSRNPDKIVTFPGMDTAEVQAMMDELIEIKKQDPSVKRSLFFGAKEPPTVVQLMDTLVDLDARELGEWYAQAIAINFGVSLPMLGIQTAGKLGNEQDALEVSYNAIEELQSQLEEFFAAQVASKFSEIVSWEWRLKSPRKSDDMQEAQVAQLRAQTVATLRQAGANATLDDKGEIKILEWAEPASSPPIPDTSPESVFSSAENPRLSALNLSAKSLKPQNMPRDAGVTPGTSKAEQELLASLERQRDKALKGIDTTDRAALTAAMQSMIADMETQLIKDATDFQVRYYQEVLEREASSEGWDPAFEQVDLDALNYMRNDPRGLQSALKRFSGDQRTRLFKSIEDVFAEPGKLSVPNLRAAIGEVIDGTRYELERIARSETNRITNTAKVARWKEYADGSAVYELVTANDNRVCDSCKAIRDGGEGTFDGATKTFHGNPYTLAEVIEIQAMGHDHPNGRDQWVRRPSLRRPR